MTIALTATAPVDDSPEDVEFTEELEFALSLVPAENLSEAPRFPASALDWQSAEAACVSQCTESYYGSAETGAPDPGVRSICASCPLQAPCIAHALVYEPWGVWGLTERERVGLGGVPSRARAVKDAPTPREAARQALAAGVTPEALAQALISVHLDHSVQPVHYLTAANPDVDDEVDDIWAWGAAS